MKINTSNLRRSPEIVNRTSGTNRRIAIALMIIAIFVPVLPCAYITAHCHAGAEVSSNWEKTEGSNSSYWQDTRPQDPVGSADRSASPKRPNDPNNVPAAAGALITSPDDYRIAPNDVIEVRIDKAPEISGMFRVSSSGTIMINYLGRITVLNKTPDQLTQTITEALRGDYLIDPHVVVEVKQYNSRAFFIQGSVRNPGLYYIEGPPSLLKLIIIAGGLADNHGSTAFIIRGIKPGESGAEAPEVSGASKSESDKDEKAKYELIKRNINGLFKGAFDQDLIIDPGDVVNIPSTEVFFVAGEVHAPGSFPLKEGTNLRQAISLAQGTTPNALGRGIIFREDPISGKRQEISVDISDVMKGKGDVVIMPNDTIMVPHSRLKTVGNTLLTAFGFGMVRSGRIPGRY